MVRVGFLRAGSKFFRPSPSLTDTPADCPSSVAVLLRRVESPRSFGIYERCSNLRGRVEMEIMITIKSGKPRCF